MSFGRIALTLSITVILGVVVPWVFMRMLVPSILGLPNSTVSNYRGRPVSAGLGIVWLIWAGCAIVGGVASGTLEANQLIQALTLAGPLALVAFSLGLVDDAYGSAGAKGFTGHLKAMVRGRLTTGGLKLIGIGLASLVVAMIIAQIAEWGSPQTFGPEPWYPARLIIGVLLAGASIALTSNFVNLTDLRPGRALKVYSVLAMAGAASTALLPGTLTLGTSLSPADRVIALFGLVIFLLGPVVAVWRYDLGETGMLGDAGANPMGAVAGMFIVLGLPLWGLAVYTALMFALNLSSERISFSKVIEATPPLRWLDELGRLSLETHPHDGGSQK